MKTVLLVLSIVGLVAVPSILVVDAAFNREAEARVAATSAGTRFGWPLDPAAGNPDDALRILTEAADGTGTNVIRTSVGIGAAGRSEITHYLYIAGAGTRLFDRFDLTAGRWPTREETRSGAMVVSSIDNSRPTVIGEPAVFANAYDLTFAPFGQALTRLPATGTYVIESHDEADVQRFLGIVQHRLAEVGVPDLTLDSLRAVGAEENLTSDTSMSLLAYSFAPIVSLLSAIAVLRDGRRIGVMRLSGYSVARIWFVVTGWRQMTAAAVGTAAGAAVLVFVPGVDWPFARNLIGALAAVIAASAIVTVTIGFAIISRVNLGDIVKGRIQ
ncbi:hypothetical protein [Catenuloplanes indicus]|uniref:Uncharacterized protein n=1 Tax=Catenuloplanes indicus TaxID=137267 RepID=A0AAE4B187_9ACTN|nr:hypothetical protein [Catenuloplanes indicus]MDQ0371160.1 hypothetical protein [Catenuloplanes indicus]